jgi:protein-tyrosine phosphatase
MTDVMHPRSSAPPSARSKRAIRAGLIAFILLAGIALGIYGLEIYRANWGVVVPGKIYRSAQMSSWLLNQKLRDNHIGTIIFLSHDDDADSDVRAEKLLAANTRIPFLNFPMMGDGVAPPGMYTEALTALCDALRSGKTVLVHCHSGAQRTGGVIAVYRMLVQKMPPDQALAEMEHYGHDPRKNLTLLPFINEHIGEWAEALVKDGVIDRVPDPLPKLTLAP